MEMLFWLVFLTLCSGVLAADCDERVPIRHLGNHAYSGLVNIENLTIELQGRSRSLNVYVNFEDRNDSRSIMKGLIKCPGADKLDFKISFDDEFQQHIIAITDPYDFESEGWLTFDIDMREKLEIHSAVLTFETSMSMIDCDVSRSELYFFARRFHLEDSIIDLAETIKKTDEDLSGESYITWIQPFDPSSNLNLIRLFVEETCHEAIEFELQYKEKRGNEEYFEVHANEKFPTSESFKIVTFIPKNPLQVSSLKIATECKENEINRIELYTSPGVIELPLYINDGKLVVRKEPEQKMRYMLVDDYADEAECLLEVSTDDSCKGYPIPPNESGIVFYLNTSEMVTIQLSNECGYENLDNFREYITILGDPPVEQTSTPKTRTANPTPSPPPTTEESLTSQTTFETTIQGTTKEQTTIEIQTTEAETTEESITTTIEITEDHATTAKTETEEPTTAKTKTEEPTTTKTESEEPTTTIAETEEPSTTKAGTTELPPTTPTTTTPRTGETTASSSMKTLAMSSIAMATTEAAANMTMETKTIQFRIKMVWVENYRNAESSEYISLHNQLITPIEEALQQIAGDAFKIYSPFNFSPGSVVVRYNVDVPQGTKNNDLQRTLVDALNSHNFTVDSFSVSDSDNVDNSDDSTNLVLLGGVAGGVGAVLIISISLIVGLLVRGCLRDRDDRASATEGLPTNPQLAAPASIDPKDDFVNASYVNASYPDVSRNFWHRSESMASTESSWQQRQTTNNNIGQPSFVTHSLLSKNRARERKNSSSTNSSEHRDFRLPRPQLNPYNNGFHGDSASTDDMFIMEPNYASDAQSWPLDRPFTTPRYHDTRIDDDHIYARHPSDITSVYADFSERRPRAHRAQRQISHEKNANRYGFGSEPVLSSPDDIEDDALSYFGRSQEIGVFGRIARSVSRRGGMNGSAEVETRPELHRETPSYMR